MGGTTRGLGEGEGRSSLKLCEDHKTVRTSWPLAQHLRESAGQGPSPTKPAAPWAEKGRLLCPKVCLLVGPTRCAPEKCKSFTVSGSPGVLVDILRTVPAVSREEAAPTRWPLQHPIDVLVKMTSPSSAIDSDKVSPGMGAGGGGDTTRKLLFPGPKSVKYAGVLPDVECSVLCTETLRGALRDPRIQTKKQAGRG